MKEKLLLLLKTIGPSTLRQVATAIESGDDPEDLLHQIVRDLKAQGASAVLDAVLDRA